MIAAQSGSRLGESFRAARLGRLLVLNALLAALVIGCDTAPSDLLVDTAPGLGDSAPPSELNDAAALEEKAFETYQRDRTKIDLVFRGDEHFNWYEDLDRYTVVLDLGEYYYAELDDRGELAPTRWLVGKVDPREQGLVPGVLPSREVIAQLRSESDAKPISYEGPNPEEIKDEYVIVEGDMVIPVVDYEQAKANGSAAVHYNANLWTNGVVPYAFDANVDSTNQARARQAMDDWEAVADVTFVPRTAETNYVHVFSGTGNWSYVGMIGGKQNLSIYNWTYEFIIAHELGHALTIWHEQSRSDRDTYVQINWGNITSGKEGNFNIHNTVWDTDVGTYDFDSCMHYGAYSFSSNGQPTIETQPAYSGASFGQRTHLSVGDAGAMAIIYGASVSTEKAAMTNPVNDGESLTGSSFTFQWSAGSGVSEYWVWIGSQLDTYDILNESQGTNLSKAVSGLATDGSSLYVRIFSLISGNWEYNAYTYSCVNIPVDKAAMADPVNDGDSLTGSSFTFQWSAGSGVSEYWMWIGSQDSTYDVLNQSQGSSLSKAVTGLPTDGSSLYVRIFSLIDGNWQYNAYTYSCVNIPVDKAAMTNPANDGDSLTGADFTFQWSAGSGVTEYWMWIGTQVDTYDLLNQSQGTGTSKAVTGLPTNGSNLYVRIFSLISGNWQYNAYTYSCVNIPVDKAAMTNPANDGDALTGSSFTFQWTAGSGVTEYWMWIGTQADTYDLLNQSQSMNTSKAVTGLPTNGSNLYVRIFSLISGTWEYNTYTYSCVNIPVDKAAMTNPANDGDALTGSSFTFQWTAGSGVTEYWMWIGTQADTYDLLNQSQGSSLSKNVTGLPTDGSNLYVRIFSLISGNWEYNSYTYVCVNIPASKAAMTNPANDGDTLTGSSFTFQWTAGSGVSEYWMWIGTQPDTYDLLNESQGSGLSKAVTGLRTDGSNLYVRVFSLISGNWEYNSYTYVCATIATSKAAMTNPANDGDTLAGSSVTFQWTVGSGVTEYWVWIGSQPDTYDMLNESQGTNLSKAVAGLPTDGSNLYVRIFSLINGDWEYNAYTYTCSSN